MITKHNDVITKHNGVITKDKIRNVFKNGYFLKVYYIELTIINLNNMSKTIYYLPNGDAQRGTWLSNFSLNLVIYKTKLGLTTDQMTSVANDTKNFVYSLLLIAASKSFDHTCITYKTSIRNGLTMENVAEIPVFTAPADTPVTGVKPGIFSRITALVRIIKAHPAYTEAMGTNLGIIGAERAERNNQDLLQPVFTVKIVAGKVQLKYAKGDTDGVRIECKRGTETEFSFLDKVSKNTFTDERKNLIPLQAEQRQYRGLYMKGDSVIGIMSDIVTIAVPG